MYGAGFEGSLWLGGGRFGADGGHRGVGLRQVRVCHDTSSHAGRLRVDQHPDGAAS